MKQTIKIGEKGNCKIIAHRGLSSFERENSCPAFIAAGVSSYYGIETDVHVTKDNRFIICHDDDISRVTGVDMSIENSNFDDIMKVRLLDTDNESYRSDLVFPVPEDYFSICKKYGKKAVFELKNKMTDETIAELVKIVEKMGMIDNTIFISFSTENIIALRKMSKKLHIQFLTCDTTEYVLTFLSDYKIGLDVYYKSLTKDFIDKVHDLDLEVNAWTCDNLSDARQLIEMGVDYITTNVLE